MNSQPLIPDFSWTKHVAGPWSGDMFSLTLWSVMLGVLVISTCGLIGNFLILRRMALLGDAISHSVLAGIAVVVVAPMVIKLGGHGHVSPTTMFIGAMVAGVFTTVLIELIHRYSRVKQDAAIGIAFTSLFALGVVLISLKVNKTHIDAECVLYGDMTHVIAEKERTPVDTKLASKLGDLPFSGAFLERTAAGKYKLVTYPGVIRMGIILLVVIGLMWLFYKELLVSSFDPGLASSLGINATVVHYALMAVISLVVVAAFESVGAILVVATLILPGATAHLLSTRMKVIFILTVIHAILSSVIGYHISVWLDCSVAGAMVVASTGLFILAWLFSPYDGLLGKWLRQQQVQHEMPEEIGKTETTVL